MQLKIAALCGALVAGTLPAVAMAADRHEGYYYPKITSSETYKARAATLTQGVRRMRIGFIVGFTEQQLKRPYAPEVAVFAKGEEAQKLLIVALNKDAISSIYQARALLAQMTSVARTSDVFVRNKVAESFTFLDMLKLMGYEQLTISDGHSYAHQIKIE